jgi:hypothetical protein
MTFGTRGTVVAPFHVRASMAICPHTRLFHNVPFAPASSSIQVRVSPVAVVLETRAMGGEAREVLPV